MPVSPTKQSSHSSASGSVLSGISSHTRIAQARTRSALSAMNLLFSSISAR